MRTGVYEAEAAVEADHWWFAGRRKLFASLISNLGLPKDAAILDIGTSTGTNLRLTRDLGFQNVVGLDASDEAVRFCAEKGLGVVKRRVMPASCHFPRIISISFWRPISSSTSSGTSSC